MTLAAFRGPPNTAKQPLRPSADAARTPPRRSSGAADRFGYTRFSIGRCRSPLGFEVGMTARMGCINCRFQLRSRWNQHLAKRAGLLPQLEAMLMVRPSLTYSTPTVCRIRHRGRPRQPRASGIASRVDRLIPHLAPADVSSTQARWWV